MLARVAGSLSKNHPVLEIVNLSVFGSTIIVPMHNEAYKRHLTA